MSHLNLDSFLLPLSDAAPCGKDLEYDPAFIALETAALGKPEQQMGDSVKEAEPPNWAAIKKDAVQLLGRTRDLRVVQVLSEASLNLHGLPGLNDCLDLCSRLLEQYWEPVHPRLDPGDDHDPTLRINILNRLCDFDRIIRPLNKIPLIESRSLGGIGLRDIQVTSGKIPAPKDGAVLSASEIAGAFRDCDPENLQTTLKVVEGCQEKLLKIEQAFTSRLGAQDAPDFSDLQAVLKEIKLVFSKQSGFGSDENEEPDSETPDRSTPDQTSTQKRSGGIQSPRDVIGVLDEICDYYRKHEPSSPIPILLKRAKNLVSKDFMEIMKDIAPDGVSQVEMFQVKEKESE